MSWGSSLKTAKKIDRDVGGPCADQEGGGESELSSQGKASLNKLEMKGEGKVEGSSIRCQRGMSTGVVENPSAGPALSSEGARFSRIQTNQKRSSLREIWLRSGKTQLEATFGDLSPNTSPWPLMVSPPADTSISIEAVLMYAFLKADLDFVTAQARKPDDETHHDDTPLNADDILGEPSHLTPSKHRIGGPKRFVGGSTASVALISTPTPTPFWHPASPSTIIVAHVGDTRESSSVIPPPV